MKHGFTGSAGIAVVLFVAGSSSAPAQVDASPQVRAGSTAPLQGFVENKGQWPDDVRFFAQAGAIELTVVDEALVLRRAPDPDTREWPAPLIVRFPHPAKAVRGEGVLSTQHHFFLGERRASHVLGYERVVCEGIADGIDLVVRRDGANFAYDLHVAAGASLEDFALEFEGATEPRLRADGSQTFTTAAGEVTQRIGKAWQSTPSEAQDLIGAEFRIESSTDGRVQTRFDVPARDASRALVIDPTLAFSTCLGAVGLQLRGVDVDAAGAIYLTCMGGAGLPTTPGTYQTVPPPLANVWAGKLSADGSALIWGTFIGGAFTDEPYGIRVDQDGTVVLAGNTWSNDYPVTPGVVQPVHGGQLTTKSDFFYSRLSPDGSALVCSTYYGGANHEGASALGLFPCGDVLIAGEPYSLDPPATPGAFDDTYNAGDRVLVRLSADATRVVFQTYFKASEIRDVAIDAAESIYLVGNVFPQQAPLPTTPGAFQTTMTPGDTANGFVARMASSGDALLWCTYLGGNLDGDFLFDIDVDAAGAAYVVGFSGGLAGDYPLTPGAFDSGFSPSSGNVVTKLLPWGSGLVWSGRIDGCCGGSTALETIAVTMSGNAVIVGNSIEGSYPVTPDAYLKTKPGPPINTSDGLLTQFDAFGESLLYSTWFGGPASAEGVSKLAIANGNDPVWAVETLGTDFPITPGAYHTPGGVSLDTAVVTFAFPTSPWTVLGGGVKGTKDIPNLAGAGLLKAGTSGRLSLRGAASNTSALLVAGAAQLGAPVLEGQFVPSPQILVPFTTGAGGGVDITFTWPAGVPAGVPAWVQVWVQDPGSGVGWSASNALRFVSQ